MSLRLLLGGVALIFAIALQPVSAQNYKIAVVDLQKAASTSPQAEAARKKIDREFGKRDRGLLAKQKAIRTREEKLVKRSATMSEDQLGRANRDLRKLRRDFQRELDEFNEDRRLRNAEELRKLQGVVIKVTERLAKDEKYDLVLIRGVVVFANERKMDVAAKVVERLKRLAKK